MTDTNEEPPPLVAGARVTVAIDWDALEMEVILDCSQESDDTGELIARSDACEYGVRFALEVASALPCAVRVTELVVGPGTGATVIAAAAARAVWGAIEFDPPMDVCEQIDRDVAEAGQTLELRRFSV